MRRLLLLLTIPLLGPSCGECSLDVTVNGTVVDADGLTLEGVEVATCMGERCEAADEDEPCDTTTTDAAGAFSLVVPMCRPAAGQCELRPIIASREDCPAVTIQPERDVDPEITLECVET